MVHILDSEDRIISGFQARIYKSLIILGAVGSISTALPLTGWVKGQLAAFSWTIGLTSFSGMAITALKLDEETEPLIKEAKKQHLENRLIEASTKQELIDRANAKVDLAMTYIQNYPLDLAVVLADKDGIGHIVRTLTGYQDPVAVDAKGDKTINAKLQTLELPGSTQEAIDIGSLYDKAVNEAVCIVGSQGEGKTSVAHYILHRWMLKIPDTMILGFDPHYGSGRTDEFKSTWLGLPKITNLNPKFLHSGIYQGDPEEMLEFLSSILAIYNHRKKHNIDRTHKDYFPIVIPIDEFTMYLKMMDTKEAEACKRLLKLLVTAAPKFGVFLLLITHSISKEETDIDRSIIRNCHMIVGCEASQDSAQMRNSPRTFSQTMLDFGFMAYQKLGKPAGYLTSLPVKDGYLPMPPVKSNNELLLNWDDTDDQTVDQTVDVTVDVTVNASVDNSEDVTSDVWVNQGDIDARKETNPVMAEIIETVTMK